MLLSLAIIFLAGLLLGGIALNLRLPPLIGMLLAGIVIGPHACNLIDSSILDMSPSLRQFALIVILLRAGLSLNIQDLKKIGRPAFFLSFLPASLEILAMVLTAPLLFPVTYLEAAILGTVVAAVSPAVIVPRMLQMIEDEQGTKKGIPQLIMAGASIDDVFVIVLFYSFLEIVQGSGFSFRAVAAIPFSILLGIIIGIIIGFILQKFFRWQHMRDTTKVLIIISIAFLLITGEEFFESWISYSGLISVMTLGIALLYFYPVLAARLSLKFTKVWRAAEVLLFVLVGAAIDLNYAAAAGLQTLLLLFFVLLFRMLGVWISLIRTNLSTNERIFCMIAYTPKATVQAAIGGIPLAMGLECGNLVLTIAVLSILITAPAGAISIDRLKDRLLG